MLLYVLHPTKFQNNEYRPVRRYLERTLYTGSVYAGGLQPVGNYPQRSRIRFYEGKVKEAVVREKRGVSVQSLEVRITSKLILAAKQWKNNISRYA